MIELTGQVRVRRLAGTINIIPGESGGGGPLQAKTVYPSHSEQVVSPDEDYYGLVSVTVKAVPKIQTAESSLTEGCEWFKTGMDISSRSELYEETGV